MPGLGYSWAVPVLRPPARSGEPELRSRAREVTRRLAAEYPGQVSELCELRHRGPFELLCATILSAQCTDERVNQVTPKLFETYPSPEDLAAADPSELEELIKPTGFFRNKAKSLRLMAAAVSERFDGEVPATMEELVDLPGVGRKTANVVLSVGRGLPGLAVDTHVKRLSKRLGLTTSEDPDRIEAELNELVEPAERGGLGLRLILHGRRVCAARKPACERCVLADICPSSALAPPPTG